MKFSEVFGLTIGGILAIVLVFALATGGRYFNWRSNQYFAPREEQVRHDTFECSQSHTDGLVRELRQIRDDYQKADPAGRAVLADRFKNDADAYTCGELPSDVQSFRNGL
jgi:hypothetical protein